MGVEIPPINLETLLIARGGCFFFFPSYSQGRSPEIIIGRNGGTRSMIRAKSFIRFEERDDAIRFDR